MVPPGVFGPDAIQYSTSASVAESSSLSEAWTHGSEASPRLALTPMSEVSMLFSETPGQSPAPPLHTPLPPRPAPVACVYPDYPAPLRPSPPEPLAVKTSKNEDGALTPIDAALVRERDILAGEVISILSDEVRSIDSNITEAQLSLKYTSSAVRDIRASVHTSHGNTHHRVPAPSRFAPNHSESRKREYKSEFRKKTTHLGLLQVSLRGTLH